MLLRLLLHAVAAFAARDHRGAMCSRCKDGALVDGGTRTVRGVGCVHWCSHAGYCGDGDSYRRGLDCRHRADVDPETLARATKEAEAQRNARYDATFVRHHGAKTFEQFASWGNVLKKKDQAVEEEEVEAREEVPASR